MLSKSILLKVPLILYSYNFIFEFHNANLKLISMELLNFGYEIMHKTLEKITKNNLFEDIFG